MKNKNRTSIILNMVLFIVAIALVVSVLLWFNGTTDRLITNTTEQYLEENVNAMASLFESKLEDQRIMLESQARYFQDVDMTRYNDMKNTILATKGIGAFKTIGVASSSGSTLNYNGRSSGNILLQDYFIEAMEGNDGISKSKIIDEEGDSVLVMAVPIHQGDKVIGAIFGSFNDEILSNLVETSSFGNRGMNLLLGSDGEIMAKSKNDSLIPVNTENFLNLIGRESFDNDIVDSMFSFSSSAGNTEVMITPVGAHDWYFATIIPSGVINEQSEKISRSLAFVILVITIALLMVGFVVIRLIKENNDSFNLNERFQKASEETHDIVFEFTYATHKLVLAGYLDDIIPGNKHEFVKDEHNILLSIIHEDDRDTFLKLVELGRHGERNVSGEMRIMTKTGEYEWYRMSGSAQASPNGKIEKFIGNVINVQEQRSKEQNLIAKAETDPLTGIYNKGAFREKVSEALAKSDESDIHALYIVDLDYFKTVNDTLGHAVGDQVLIDVAKKLLTVFSDKDIVGRIGGDEFAAFLKIENIDREMGLTIVKSKAAAIVRKMKETYSLDDKEVTVSSSVGVAIYPDAALEYEKLFKCADIVLYDVKTGGKNNYKIYG